MSGKYTSDFKNDQCDVFPADKVGGINQEWKTKIQESRTLEKLTPERDIMRGQQNVNDIIQNVSELDKPRVDYSKLIMPLSVDRSQYESNEDLYHAISEWWIKIKGRSPKTIKQRIQCAREMERFHLFPVDWVQFQPEQILNQMLYRQNVHYPKIQEETGKPTYGTTHLNNLWKTVKTFAQAFGIDITYWGYSPPSPPEPQVKIVPRPIMVNKLIHFKYTSDRYENALIRTILTVGFHSGLRPEELLTIKVDDIRLNEGYILISEQKKRYRERQVWLDDPVLYSRQQNSLKNYIGIWRPRVENNRSRGILFIQKNGTPFPTEDALRMYLAPFVKPVWNDFKPKIMRDWSAIARLIRTKVETKKWDTRTVKNALGHKYEKTTESYIQYAENYFRKDPYDWLRAVLKFHKNSKRMLSLMKEDYGPSQKYPKILTNAKNSPGSINSTGGKIYEPGGVDEKFLPLEISTNAFRTRLIIRLFLILNYIGAMSLQFSFFYRFLGSINPLLSIDRRYC